MKGPPYCATYALLYLAHICPTVFYIHLVVRSPVRSNGDILTFTYTVYYPLCSSHIFACTCIHIHTHTRQSRWQSSGRFHHDKAPGSQQCSTQSEHDCGLV